MTADTSAAAVGISRPTGFSRVYGLGGVFAKSLRDSRRAMLVAGFGVGLIVLATATQVASEFGTAEARATMATLPEQLPAILRGLLGEPINVGTLGGFLSWRTLNFVPIMLGVWSIVALSGTIATEARRGSLDIVASLPISRARIATQKGAAHLASMAVACLIAGLFTWLATLVFGTLPGDELALSAVLSHMLWLGLVAIAPGLVAWILAPVSGRSAAAGLGAIVMLASYIIYSYSEAVAAFEPLAPLSYLSWTAGHRPMAGVSDWASLGLLAGIEAVLFVVGVVVFRSRDIGVTINLGLPVPRLTFGLGGPFGRSFAQRLPGAAAFGVGLGLLGLIFALNARSLIESIGDIPQLLDIYRRFFPGVDVLSPPGVLQLTLFGFGSLVMVGAAALAAAGWASDESELRLEMLLAVPMSRSTWVLRSGLGMLAALAAMALIVAVLVGLGVVIVGGDPITPVIGSLALGLYAASLAGLGLAVGGWFRPALAAIVPAALGLAFYLLDILGAALQLPKVILDLSLTRHLGQPMAGSFDWVGIALCAVLAVGGVFVGAIGFQRCDVER